MQPFPLDPSPALSRLRPTRLRALMALCGFVIVCAPGPALAQEPDDVEVRQLVTFRFLPGRAGDAIQILRERALPLYRSDAAMRSFVALREVESPVPLDLVAVRAFAGMSGMDASNEALGRLARDAGTTMGDIYGAIASLSANHDDQFVEILADLTTGDPTEERLVALVWYRSLPGEQGNLERHLADVVVPWERDSGVPSETGRFLVADGWTHLRFLGFASLGAYQRYWRELRDLRRHGTIQSLTAVRREVILAPVPGLSVR